MSPARCFACDQKHEAVLSSRDQKRKAKVERKIMPYGPNESILLLGEGTVPSACSFLSTASPLRSTLADDLALSGTPLLATFFFTHTHTANFSFALSLAKNHPVTASRLTATAYDSQATTYEKYPDAESNVGALVDLGATVLFDVDAGRLELTKEVKTQGLTGGGWDKVIWNFPHAGLGEKDQARNIALNQALLLKFFRSVSPFLTKGASRSEAPVKVPKGKGKGKARESDDEEDREVEMVDEDGEEYLGGQMHEEEEEEEKETKKGTVLVTLRNAEPYTSWCACVLPCLRRVLADESVFLTLTLSLCRNLPRLLKRPPPPPPITSLAPSQRPPPHSTLPPTQPRFTLVRSFNFHASLYPGYAHRRTIGFQPGLSKANNEEVDGRGGGRTVEAELIEESMFAEEDGTAEEREEKKQARREALREEKEAKGRRRGNGFKDHRNREFKPPAEVGKGWAGRSNADILAGAVTSG